MPVISARFILNTPRDHHESKRASDRQGLTLSPSITHERCSHQPAHRLNPALPRVLLGEGHPLRLSGIVPCKAQLDRINVLWKVCGNPHQRNEPATAWHIA